ncbi:MAG: hypothetical protein E6Q24_15340 [Chitinophagaceae bacterium]|nr:MAG: hypothetical protein E6Q24_15340 [Chitinophagaceae bacterium]
MQTLQRSRLMRLSWEIQKRRKSNRSKSLFSAWAIYLNEDITVYYLVRKHTTRRQPDPVPATHLSLFYSRH